MAMTYADMNLVPTVVEQSGRGERAFDIFPVCCATVWCFSPVR